jgi:hypothetical protein
VNTATGRAFDPTFNLEPSLRADVVRARERRAWMPDQYKKIHSWLRHYGFKKDRPLIGADLESALQTVAVKASSSVQADLRPAPEAEINRAIAVVYDRADANHTKPPNIRELVSPVRELLAALGYKSSSSQIQSLGSRAPYAARRLKQGQKPRSA